MKFNFKHILMGLAVMPLMTSCLEEAFPESSTVTRPMIGDDIDRLASAIPAFMTNFNSDDTSDIGWASKFIWRDSMTQDVTIASSNMDYFWYFTEDTYLGNWGMQQDFWRDYYKQIYYCKLVLDVADPENQLHWNALADAHAFRAMCYLEMAQWYEFKRTSNSELDSYAEANGLWGLTVPLVTETTTEEEGRNNPRIDYGVMYRYINNELTLAAKYLADDPAREKNHVSLSVVNGLQARLWLLIATRLRIDQGSEQILKDADSTTNPGLANALPLGVTTATAAYEKTIQYARAAQQGHAPLTEAEWFNTASGFNDSSAESWMWAILINENNGLASNGWVSWPSFMAPEAGWGISTSYYQGTRLIDMALFNSIDENDWRRATWIAPEDVADEDAYNETYKAITKYDYDEWSQFVACSSFKFRPGNGEMTNSNVGNAIDIPLMRVEEMMFIEIEAIACSQGAAAGRAALADFMNTYRMKSGETYYPMGVGLEGVIEEIIKEKRIEFWGEGLTLWDLRRLYIPVTKGYEGTNHPESTTYNSFPGGVPSWSNLYIPNGEKFRNQACKLNPDPSQKATYWTAPQ